MPPETASSPHTGKDAGFTLLELLVCLVLMAAIAAFAMPRFAGERPLTFAQQADAIVADLARLREAAIGTGEVRRASAAALAAVLPEGVRVGTAEPPEIVVFPNGMANGAVWRLEADERVLELEIDWLTGRITLDGP